jgi:hypothetical protein
MHTPSIRLPTQMCTVDQRLTQQLAAYGYTELTSVSETGMR